MSFKEKLAKRYTESYISKYGDRLTQVQGNVLSYKIEKEKCILWIFYKLQVSLIVKPERSKSVVKCVYKKNSWFKRPSFMTIHPGNLVIIQGMKGKKGKDDRETIQILNVKNLTTKKDLVAVDGQPQKIQRVQKVQRIK